VFKIILIILVVVLAIISVSILGLYINHRVKLNREAEEFSPPGEMVEINEKQFHVYSEGNGPSTLVFLSGHGTSYPTLDFKPLWSKFAQDYRIVVIEKPGYGWSEPSDSPRDIDTILEETRTALDLAGESGPYILFPHSMSGLEAIYWAQKYPTEVQAIIGLDPLILESVELLPKTSKSQLNMVYFISRIGLSRLMPSSEIANTLPLLDSDELSEEEKDEYVSIFYKSSLTKNMLEEFNQLKNNAQTIMDNSLPIETPMYFFISTEQSELVEGWKDALIDYAANLNIGQTTELSTSHYIHHDESQAIYNNVISFFQQNQID